MTTPTPSPESLAKARDLCACPHCRTGNRCSRAENFAAALDEARATETAKVELFGRHLKIANEVLDKRWDQTQALVEAAEAAIAVARSEQERPSHGLQATAFHCIEKYLRTALAAMKGEEPSDEEK
jgi:hypothetical protein